MIQTLIVYDSLYGSTEEVARDLALILGPSRSCRVKDFNPSCLKFDFLVLGGPVYKGVLTPALWNFAQERKSWIKEKRLALFCTCLDEKDGRHNLSRLESTLGVKPLVSQSLGGRMLVEKLEAEDLLGMEAFCKAKGFAFQDTDTISMESVVSLGLRIKAARDALVQRMPLEDLRSLVETFLGSHNTCTLATCGCNRPRATPLEFTYHQGGLYILSEGGEKFANLLQNRKVSVAIYDEYRSMEDLAGMQITGEAMVVSRQDPEYALALRLKGIRPERILSLPIEMHLIRVDIHLIEFLSAKMRRAGYPISQTLNGQELLNSGRRSGPGRSIGKKQR